jgi:hypothetical protein
MGFRAESTNTSGVITVAGVDQVVINNAGNVAATTFTGALAGNASTATKFASTTGAAPVYGARAWVSFDATRNAAGTATAAFTTRFIRGSSSGNVTSVLKFDNGAYRVNFGVDMPTADYALVGATGAANKLVTYAAPVFVSSQTTSSCDIYVGTHSANSNPTTVEMPFVNIAIFV